MFIQELAINIKNIFKILNKHTGDGGCVELNERYNSVETSSSF